MCRHATAEPASNSKLLIWSIQSVMTVRPPFLCMARLHLDSRKGNRVFVIIDWFVVDTRRERGHAAGCNGDGIRDASAGLCS
eukprot:scaffold18942_cov63-Phaeocystis_antarctica.AAC.7